MKNGIVWVVVALLVFSNIGSFVYLSNKISDVQESVVVIQGDVSSINNNVSSISNSVSSLESEVSIVGRSVRSLESDVNYLNNSIRDVKISVGSLDRRVDSNADSLSLLSRYLAVLAGNVSSLDVRVRELEDSRIALPWSSDEFYGSKSVDKRAIFDLFEEQAVISAGAVGFVTDKNYKALPESKLGEFMKFLNWSGIPGWSYSLEDRDCDDFAFEMGAFVRYYYPDLAFGVVISDVHAFNFVVVDNGRDLVLYYVEPQTGYIFKALDARYDDSYTGVEGIII